MEENKVINPIRFYNQSQQISKESNEMKDVAKVSLHFKRFQLEIALRKRKK